MGGGELWWRGRGFGKMAGKLPRFGAKPGEPKGSRLLSRRAGKNGV